ncbi:hypothetical protein [Staphylococcus phage vB_SauH_DELF3]|nr:hypothetical protein [Staphylococcus phage vB_SauH_DELF3]
MPRNPNDRKKKSDIKVVHHKESLLSRLYNTKELRSKVDNAIDEDVSYDDIIDLCTYSDLELSNADVTEYKSISHEAMRNGWEVNDVIDKRKKVSATQTQKKEKPMKELVRENDTPFELATQNVQTRAHDIQILDMILQKGAKGLIFVETLDPADMTEAMVTKDRITGNQLKGMDFIGLRELLVDQQAQDTATTEVMLPFIPEDEHEEVLQRMEPLQEEFNRKVDLTDPGKRSKDTLDRVGYTI